MMLGGANANLSVDAKLREILGPDAMTPPRAVKVDVDPAGETLVLGGEVKSEPMEPSAVFEAVSELLEDSVPCLVLLSLHGVCETTKEQDYAMIAWTPDVSPMKLRMLCASSRRTLREEFTHLHFKEYNATERREVTWAQYQESTRARTEQDRFAAMTQDEIDQLEVRKQVAKEQAMAPKKLAGLAGMQVKVNETFESSMKRFLDSEIPLAVVAKLDQEELFAEILEIGASLPSALKGKLPTEPCFVIMAAKGDQLLFITWLPEGAAVRQKMKTSTFKASVLDQVKAFSDKDLVMAEVSEDDDLEDSLADSQKVPEAACPVAPEAPPSSAPKGPKPPAGAVALPGLSPTKPGTAPAPAQGYSESPVAPSRGEESAKTPLFEEQETAGKMAFATSPQASAEISETLSLAELQDASVWKGRNVIATERERYLPEDVFQSLTRKSSLPKSWRSEHRYHLRSRASCPQSLAS